MVTDEMSGKKRVHVAVNRVKIRGYYLSFLMRPQGGIEWQRCSNINRWDLCKQYVCGVITYSKSVDQPGKKVANPARGQLNRETTFFPVPVRNNA